MSDYSNEFVDKYFQCYKGRDKSLLFVRPHDKENILYVSLFDTDFVVYNDMYIPNPAEVVVKGIKFEYACIQNKSLELDGEKGEADYDTFLHVDGYDIYLLYSPDINSRNQMGRTLVKYERMITPADFEM